jgi:hypothetical protein
MGWSVDYGILFIVSFYCYCETRWSELRCYPIVEYWGKGNMLFGLRFVLNLIDIRDRLLEKFTP